MTTTTVSVREVAVEAAKDEITDYTLYKKLSEQSKNKPKLRETFSKLSETEYGHYQFWGKYCPEDSKEIRPSSFRIYFTILVRFFLGASFAIKFLERNETSTIAKYKSVAHLISPEDMPEFEKMIRDEQEHELKFAEEVQGGYVKYISFIVLGLADALVEIAGIHAGSLGIYNSTELTGLAGIVAGASASIAMASAAYAQAKQRFEGSSSLAAFYTGISYFISAVLLATPYFLTKDMTTAITLSLVFGVLIIAATSYYNSVISNESFKRNFGELAGVMLGATLALYIFGLVIRSVFEITI